MSKIIRFETVGGLNLSQLPDQTIAVLEIRKGPGDGEGFAITRDCRQVIVGRHRDADNTIKSKAASSWHFNVIVSRNLASGEERFDFKIVDHDSLNGTFVNREEVIRRPGLDEPPPGVSKAEIGPTYWDNLTELREEDGRVPQRPLAGGDVISFGDVEILFRTIES